jgi:hypothetical protein
MRATLLAILIFFSCLSFVSAQKKYLAKIQTLEGKWHKGVLMKVDSNGIFVLPKKMGWSNKDPKINFKKAKFFDFREIKIVKVRRKGSTDKGMIIGASIGLITSLVVANNVINNYNKNYQYSPSSSATPLSSPGLNAFGAYITLVPLLTSGVGGVGSLIGGHFPNKYKIDNHSSNFKDLITELKKYEWYHAEKDTLIIK